MGEYLPLPAFTIARDEASSLIFIFIFTLDRAPDVPEVTGLDKGSGGLGEPGAVKAAGTAAEVGTEAEAEIEEVDEDVGEALDQ